MPRVLILEDETVLRAATARALAKLPAEVVEAATLAEALAQLDRGLPDVIVSDLDLPDGSGIELIGELGRRRARVPVVFVSAYLRAFRAQIPPHADVEVREKPVALDELRALVRERIGGVDEAIAPFAVADYLQLACMGKHSVAIEVTTTGKSRGRIEVVRGDIWHAVDEVGPGLDAFRRLTFAAATEVACRTLRGAPGTRTIEGKWEALLLDTARAHDEASWDGPAEVEELDPNDAAALEAALDEFDLEGALSAPADDATAAGPTPGARHRARGAPGRRVRPRPRAGDRRPARPRLPDRGQLLRPRPRAPPRRSRGRRQPRTPGRPRVRRVEPDRGGTRCLDGSRW
jgi:CheY-like chemotaxis protein